MGKTSSTVKNRYNEKKYDRILIVIPKGQKATIEGAAKAARESVNRYIAGAILSRMGLDEWPEKEDSDAE